MRLNGEAHSLSEIKIDQNVYLLLRKLSYWATDWILPWIKNLLLDKMLRLLKN